MLALETGDNWAFAIDIDIGGAETYTNAEADAFASIEALVAWANSPVRGWFGLATFSWSWLRDSATGGATMVLTSSGFAFDITAGAHDRLGIPADAGVNEVTGDQPASGTWAPVSRMAVRRNMRVLERGDANGAGSVRPGTPGSAVYRPEVSAIGTAIDAARLAAVLAVASSPRRGWVYQLHTAEWLQLAFGAPNRTPVDTTHYRLELPAMAVTL